MGTIADKLAYTKQARDEIVAAIVDKGVDCPSAAPFCTFDDYIAQISGGGSAKEVSIINYHYEYTSSSTSHSRTYSGTAGNTILLLVLHRGELTTTPTDWNFIGTLEESGEYTDGAVTYIQYISIFTKTCTGDEVVSYASALSTISLTCFIEFDGASVVELIESTRQENIVASDGLTCVSKTNSFAIWVTSSVYFLSNTYTWDVSDENIWQLSIGDSAVPRIGVFVDTREGRNDFTIESGLSSSRYNSCLCLSVKPASAPVSREPQYILKDGTLNYDVLVDGADFNNISNTFATTGGSHSEPAKEYGSDKVYGWGDINGNAFTFTDGKFYKAQNSSIGSSETNIDIPVKNLTGRKMIGIKGSHLNDNGGWSVFYLYGLKIDPSTGLTVESKSRTISALSGYTTDSVNSGDYFFCSYVNISELSQLDYIRLRVYDGEWNVDEIFII